MRRLVTLLAMILSAALAARAVAAQQVSGLPRVGLLFFGSQESVSRGSALFREGMQSLGWTGGATSRSSIASPMAIRRGCPQMPSTSLRERSM
jgi:hypothetical protein